MTARDAARRGADAADDLLLWLNSQRRTPPVNHGDTSVSAPPDEAIAIAGAAEPVAPSPGSRVHRSGPDLTSAALRLAHTDWLHHRLTVSGPADTIANFRAAACGTGIIPWRLDFDRMAEDFFLLLAAPPAPQQRTLSVQGARVLAGQLCAAVANRQAAAHALVARSRAWRDARSKGDAWLSPAPLCPLDLHALVPIPNDILYLGPDHPQALAWLWTHWGTTETLRHVAEPTAPFWRRQPSGDPRPEISFWEISFWSADWTPWQALAQVAARWPTLRFDTQPSYENP